MAPPKTGVSFSDAVSNKPTNGSFIFPKKDQAIVFPLVDDITNEEYINALCDFVQPSKILFSSRMSNGRFCVYLDCVATVDIFLQIHGEIVINGQTIEARRFVNPFKKLIISNVCPIIPHNVIEKELQDKVGLALQSPMFFLKAGFTRAETKHILSFRRSILYEPETDSQFIPDSLLINYDGEDYRIFITTENNLTCFNCKQTGHQARACPNKIEIAKQQQSMTDEIEQSKRPAPPSSVSTDMPATPSQSTASPSIKKKRIKKRKISNDQTASYLSIEEIELIKKQLSVNPDVLRNQIPMTELVSFFSNLKDAEDKLKYTKTFSDDFVLINNLTEDIKPLVNKDAKRTFSCYQKILNREITADESSLSESSEN